MTISTSVHRVLLAKAANRADVLTRTAIALGQMHGTDPFTLVKGRRVPVAVRVQRGRRSERKGGER